MRVGVNLLYLLPTLVGGTEAYARGLLHALAEVDRDEEFVVFVNREAAAWPLPDTRNVHRVVCGVRGPSRWRRYAYEQFVLPRLLRTYRVDVLHSLGYVGPVVTRCPCVVTVHDLNFVDQRDTFTPARRLALGGLTRICSARAAHVIADSQFSKARVERVLRVRADKVTAIYLGAATSTCGERPCAREEVAACYGLSERYVMCFGGGALHKNIARLVRAFAVTRTSADHHLVIVGHVPADAERELRACRADLRKRISITGFVPREHVGPLLAGSAVFVLPSLYEGFGMPVLEAQLAGAVVACSVVLTAAVLATGATVGLLDSVLCAGAMLFVLTSGLYQLNQW